MNMDDREEDRSSSPFSPLFNIEVRETANNVESQIFVISVVKADGSSNTCTRDFNDLEYLHQCLTTQIENDGHVIPSFPPHPLIGTKNAAQKSKRRYGVHNRYSVPDLLQTECRNVEKYLQMLAAHPTYGTHPAFVTFLTGDLVPVRSKVKPSLVRQLSQSVLEAWHSSHQDIDEPLQDMRLWTANYAAAIVHTTSAFQKLSDSQIRLACAYSELGKQCVAAEEGSESYRQLQMSQLFIKLAEALEDMKSNFESQCTNNENTLGFELELYSRYIDNVKLLGADTIRSIVTYQGKLAYFLVQSGDLYRDVLFRRTCLLIDYENANKALEKCKPARRAEAEAAKDKAEKLYDKCTEIVKWEMKKFQDERILVFRDALVRMSEAQIKVARESYELLLKTSNEIKKTVII